MLKTTIDPKLKFFHNLRSIWLENNASQKEAVLLNAFLVHKMYGIL